MKMFWKERRGRRRTLDNNLNKRRLPYLELESPPCTGQKLISTSSLRFLLMLTSNWKHFLLFEHAKYNLALHLCNHYFLLSRIHFPQISFSSILTPPKHNHFHYLTLIYLDCYIFISLYYSLCCLCYITNLFLLCSLQLKCKLYKNKNFICSIQCLYSQDLKKVWFRIHASSIYCLYK